MDHDELAIRRDLEHAETAAADLIDLDPDCAIPFMVKQVGKLAAYAEAVGNPGPDLLAHCLWLGWEKAYRTWLERDHHAPESEHAPDPED